MNLNLKLIKRHTTINRGTVIHPSIFSVIGPYPFQPYVKLNQTFFPENLDILSKILKIMTRLTLMRKVKNPPSLVIIRLCIEKFYGNRFKVHTKLSI